MLTRSRHVERHLVADDGVVVVGHTIVEFRAPHVFGVEADNKVEIAVHVRCRQRAFQRANISLLLMLAAMAAASGPISRRAHPKPDMIAVWRAGLSRRSKRFRYGRMTLVMISASLSPMRTKALIPRRAAVASPEPPSLPHRPASSAQRSVPDACRSGAWAAPRNRHRRSRHQRPATA